MGSTASLGPIQSSSGMGPGQKMQQPQSMVRKVNNKSLMVSSEQFGSAKVFSMTQRQVAAPTVSSFVVKPETKKETPIIKLTKITTVNTDEKNATEAEETKTTTANTTSQAAGKSTFVIQKPQGEKEGEPVSEIFKQRLTQFRRNISKTMVFAD